MTCGRYESWIALAAGGDLQPRRTRRLVRHLAGCERCREYAAAMSCAREAFLDLADQPAGGAELAAVRVAVMARVTGERTGPAFAWRWALAPIAAAAALMIVFWVWVPEVTPPGVGRESPPTAPSGRGSVTPDRGRPGRPPANRRGPATRAAGATRGSRAGEGARPTSLRKIQAIAPREPDGDIVVRLETNDPNVVIYWVMQSGETE